MSANTEALTRDSPAPGLVVYQPRRGFRYAMDPFFLAAWALEGAVPNQVADLCCGSGIMALLLARLGVAASGYDVRPEWITLARRSAQESGLQVAFIRADVRHLGPAALDLVVLNPPYLPVGSGPVSPDPWKAAARSELNGTLGELVAAAARLGRRVAVVLPHSRAAQGQHAMEAAGLTLTRRCWVLPALVLLEGGRDPATLQEESVSTREGDEWSLRVRAWYGRLGARLGAPSAPRPGPGQCK